MTTLLDELETLKDSPNYRKCKLQTLVEQKLTPEEQTALTVVLFKDPDDPYRATNAQIARTLRKGGLDVTNSSVDRHRSRQCPCYRTDSK